MEEALEASEISGIAKASRAIQSALDNLYMLYGLFLGREIGLEVGEMWRMEIS